MQRRSFLGQLALASLGTLATPRPADARLAARDLEPLRKAMAACEHDSGGRLGLVVHAPGDGARLSWRGGERFPMCSTFKWLLAAAVLARCDAGRESLARRIPVTAGDLVAHSPFAETRTGRDATVDELCKATITLSDNAAANLLLPAVGGPAGLTRFVRTLGDRHTRLDRTEPELNSAIAGDPRDTTTPAAMVEDLHALLLGTHLAPASRARLLGWLRANTTGDARLRAGLPAARWRVGDKTGAGANGTTNDVAIIERIGGGRAIASPVLVACYLTGSPLDGEGRNAIVARVGVAIATAFGGA